MPIANKTKVVLRTIRKLKRSVATVDALKTALLTFTDAEKLEVILALIAASDKKATIWKEID